MAGIVTPRELAGPCPPWVDPAWWEVAGRELREWRLAGPVWIAKLAHAWGIVRVSGALTVPETMDQTAMINFRTGRWFHQTRPRFMFGDPRAWEPGEHVMMAGETSSEPKRTPWEPTEP